ncbi:MAG: hypothetical protein HY868_25515 [Chloroflexi bacterium]|nr:hypothetical protein [Chloroflexota bacterium]
MYDLARDGVDDFYARRPGAQRLVRREPLSGIVDGANKTFIAQHPTWLLSSLKVYVGDTVYTSADLTCDPDGGVIQFPTAPTVQPLADYTVVPLTKQQIVYFVWAGFDLMEVLWTRGFSLSKNNLLYEPATYTDASIYICQRAQDGTVVDPTIGAVKFSESHPQKMVIAQCTELAYMDSLFSEAAASDISYRERITGIALDSSLRPRNLKLAREVLFASVRNAIYAAMEEAGDIGQFSAQTLPPHSADYEAFWHWQKDSPYGGLTVPGTLRWNLA